ncbi:Soluble lytic murein transglycosylase [Granulibacter bethesdensis]|uniref:Soluble lytic murein transglycosylase n=2 Tax=Granulibacter bethesdensis TaxID=364410 RepID=A0AAC9K8D1_9PROT|nr:Soluble lytic murein transglycosylase [Granulibacter bethesdensis]APH62750.1 Soluble lytic murein transglycosylase [Granulibacter bethesdensis]
MACSAPLIMRGIRQSISRLAGARALLAGAAFLASAASGHAQSMDEVAMAMPRIHPPQFGVPGLPQPLSPSDAALVRHIFDAQAHGDLTEARQATDRLDTSFPLGKAMLGHILADRYLGAFHKSTPAELKDWLAHYPNHPSAPAIHALLLTKADKKDTLPPAPQVVTFDPAPGNDPVPEDETPQDISFKRLPGLDHSVHERAASGHADAALRMIAANTSISATYGAQLRAEVAQILFTLNQDNEALRIALEAEQQGHGKVGLGSYVSGLLLWRKAEYQQAMAHFEAAWSAEMTSTAIRTAGAFWAARSHLRSHDPANYTVWMHRAAEQPRTFYGLLARRVLGVGIEGSLSLTRETLGTADLEAISATEAGKTAFALLQVEQPDRAEQEFRRLAGQSLNNTAMIHALMLVADKAGLHDLSAQLAALNQAADGQPHDYARFPVPALKPQGGFSISPALVYGLTRVESNFNASAVSAVGARGLMQLMPQTANYVAETHTGAARLHDPAVNLKLGQRYVAYLADSDVTGGDLLRILASYNSGPTSFSRWGAQIQHHGDPLLFIEAIPLEETRSFIQRTLTYSWIYAARLGIDAPGLDELAAGIFPHFTAATPDSQSLNRMKARLH